MVAKAVYVFSYPLPDDWSILSEWHGRYNHNENNGIVVSCPESVFVQSSLSRFGLQALRTKKSYIFLRTFAVCFIIQTAVGNQGAVLHLKLIVVIILAVGATVAEFSATPVTE